MRKWIRSLFRADTSKVDTAIVKAQESIDKRSAACADLEKATQKLYATQACSCGCVRRALYLEEHGKEKLP